MYGPAANVLGVRTRDSLNRGVLLTFDDGPHPDGTPAVLELLEAAGAKAVFFLVGEQVERRPALAAEIAGAGHEIGLHCHRHRNLLRLGQHSLIDDLERAAAAIAAATGRRPLLHRPPYGVYSWQGLAAVRRRGLEPLLWSRWGRDWSPRATPRSIAAKATRDLSAGDVVLLHDSDAYSAPESWRRTAAALPWILDAASRAAEGAPLR